MLRRSGHDTPPSWDSASVIGARGAPQNAVRSALVASAGGALSGAAVGGRGGVRPTFRVSLRGGWGRVGEPVVIDLVVQRRPPGGGVRGAGFVEHQCEP